MTRFPETERARLLALLARFKEAEPEACPSCGCEIEHHLEAGLPVSRCAGCEALANLPEEDWRADR